MSANISERFLENMECLKAEVEARIKDRTRKTDAVHDTKAERNKGTHEADID